MSWGQQAVIRVLEDTDWGCSEACGRPHGGRAAAWPPSNAVQWTGIRYSRTLDPTQMTIELTFTVDLTHADTVLADILQRKRQGQWVTLEEFERLRAAYEPTEAYQRMRLQCFKDAGGLCQARLPGCRLKATDVHHQTYQRYGQEWPQDVVALCRECHDARHLGRSRKMGNGHH